MIFDSRAPIKLMSVVHEFWYRATNGVVGGNILGAQILLLTTTGRKSGKRYTTPLLYVRDGDDLVVIASNGGAKRDPDWWRNLRADPAAMVQAGRQYRDVHAEAASGETRERLWASITKRYPVYAGYARRTEREIPVVLLHPGAV